MEPGAGRVVALAYGTRARKSRTSGSGSRGEHEAIPPVGVALACLACGRRYTDRYAVVAREAAECFGCPAT